MKVQDLRIGNLVLHEGKVKKINEIGLKEMSEGICGYVGFEGQRTGTWLEHKGKELVKPIPLSVEWLEKFGFDGDKYPIEETFSLDISTDERFDYKTLLKIIVMDDYCIIHISDIEDGPIGEINNVSLKNINYAHQLQNLYFALIGEELKFKKAY